MNKMKYIDRFPIYIYISRLGAGKVLLCSCIFDSDMLSLMFYSVIIRIYVYMTSNSFWLY